MLQLRWVVLVMGLAGCVGPFSPQACTTAPVPALRVTVVDSLTGNNLAPDATVWARDGAFVDTLRTWTRTDYVGPIEGGHLRGCGRASGLPRVATGRSSRARGRVPSDHARDHCPPTPVAVGVTSERTVRGASGRFKSAE